MENLSKPKGILEYLIWPFAFIWYLGVQARKKAYGGGIIDRLISYPVAFVMTAAASSTVARHVGWTNEHSFLVWLPAALFVAWVTEHFLWPFAYVMAANLSDLVAKVSSKLAKAACPGFIGLLKNLPGVAEQWDTITADERKSWFSKALTVLTYVVSILASAHLAWSVTEVAHGWLNITFLGLGWVIAGFVGVAAFAVVCRTLVDVIEEGKLPGIAMGTGLVGVYFLTTLVGVSVVTAVGAVAGFVVYCAYVFPWANILLTERLQQLVEWVKPLMKQSYEAKEGDYRLLFHHAVNLVATVLLSVFAYQLSSSMHWPLAACLVATVVTAVLAYFGVIETVKNGGGNIIVGLLLSGWTAYEVGGSVTYFGWIGEIIVGVFAGTLVFTVVFPLLYAVLAELLQEAAAGLGERVDKFHKTVYEAVKKLHKKIFNKAWDETYSDRTNFSKFSGHILNVLFAVTVIGLLDVYVVQRFEGLMYLLLLFTAGAAGAISYLVFGRLAEKDGAQPVAVGLSLAAGAYVGINASLALTWTWWVADLVSLGIGIVVAYLFALYVFAPVYWGLKLALSKIPGSDGFERSVSGFLSGFHKIAWELFEDRIWKHVREIYYRFREIFDPIYVRVEAAWNDFMRMIDRWFPNRAVPAVVVVEHAAAVDDPAVVVGEASANVVADGNSAAAAVVVVDDPAAVAVVGDTSANVVAAPSAVAPAPVELNPEAVAAANDQSSNNPLSTRLKLALLEAEANGGKMEVDEIAWFFGNFPEKRFGWHVDTFIETYCPRIKAKLEGMEPMGSEREAILQASLRRNDDDRAGGIADYIVRLMRP